MSIKSTSLYQLDLFDKAKYEEARSEPQKDSRSGSFVDNMKLPVHRWFRYSAGFSAQWVRQVVREHRGTHNEFTVLDPFAGSGTTLLACDAEHVQSFGLEAHPFICRVAKVKTQSTNLDVSALKEYCNDFIAQASSTKVTLPEEIPPLLKKCFTDDALLKLAALKETFLSHYSHGDPESELLWLIITSILRSSSFAGTAQWQYILPNKKKSKVRDPFDAYRLKTAEILADISYIQQNQWKSLSSILLADARDPNLLRDIKVDAVITSPPYPNYMAR